MSAQETTASERADRCLAALDDAGRATARRVLLRLVDFGDGGPDTRRHQPLSSLGTGEDSERLAHVLRHLTEARLLAVDGGEDGGEARIELADETLIASWPALQASIRAHGRAEQLRRQLETDAAQWRERTSQGVGEAGLLDRRQLREHASWLTPETRRDLGVSDVADSFLAASRAAARRRWWPGRATTGPALAILLILLILATPITLLFIVVLAASVIHRFG